MATTMDQKDKFDQRAKFRELRLSGVAREDAIKQAYGSVAPMTPNTPVAPPSPTPTTPPQTMQGVNGETFQVAPTNPQTGLSQPPQTPAPQPVQAQVTPTPEPTIAGIQTPTPTPEVKPTPIKEATIDYTQAKGREQEIIANLDSFKAKGMTPDEIMKASDYQNATPEKRALIDPYLKTQSPTASGMFNAILAKQDISDEQKISTAFKVAQNRYTKANMYSSMTPAQLSQAMTDVKLIE